MRSTRQCNRLQALAPAPAGQAPPPPPPPPPPAGCSTTATANVSADCDSGSASPITVSAATGDTSPSGVDGNQVAQLANGNWLKYTGVNFGTTGSTQFDARVASGAAAGVSGLVNVVLDSPTNAPAGSFAVGYTGGWTTWKTIPANITKVTGTHTVYLEFSSGPAVIRPS
jgi:Carbohydrate binding module (family 6)